MFTTTTETSYTRDTRTCWYTHGSAEGTCSRTLSMHAANTDEPQHPKKHPNHTHTKYWRCYAACGKPCMGKGCAGLRHRQQDCLPASWHRLAWWQPELAENNSKTAGSQGDTPQTSDQHTQSNWSQIHKLKAPAAVQGYVADCAPLHMLQHQEQLQCGAENDRLDILLS